MESVKFICFYHFKGEGENGGVNVVSKVDNAWAAKERMLEAYKKTMIDIDRSGPENKNAPYFDGTHA